VFSQDGDMKWVLIIIWCWIQDRNTTWLWNFSHYSIMYFITIFWYLSTYQQDCVNEWMTLFSEYISGYTVIRLKLWVKQHVGQCARNEVKICRNLNVTKIKIKKIFLKYKKPDLFILKQIMIFFQPWLESFYGEDVFRG